MKIFVKILSFLIILSLNACTNNVQPVEFQNEKILGTLIVGAVPGVSHERIDAYFNAASSINSNWVRLGLI